jgi:hypothetical protein
LPGGYTLRLSNAAFFVLSMQCALVVFCLDIWS